MPNQTYTGTWHDATDNPPANHDKVLLKAKFSDVVFAVYNVATQEWIGENSNAIVWPEAWTEIPAYGGRR